MTIYLGIDVHSKNSVYCAQDSDGAAISQGQVSTSPEGFSEMFKHLGSFSEVKIGMETGAQSAWLSRYFASLGHRPVVIDAGEVRIKSRRPNQKCDRRDAFEICDGLRRGIYRKIVLVPEPGIERLRILLSRRRHFVRICTAEVNAAKGLLRSHGFGGLAKSLTRWAAWEKLLSACSEYSSHHHLRSHASLWRAASSEVLVLERELKAAVAPFQEVFDRFQEIPGVGPITAASFIAALGDIGRFPSSAHVVSYLGLAPSSWDTGDRVIHGHITKRGNPEARSMMVEAAHHASRPQHPLHPYFTRLLVKHGYKKATVAIAQRLVRIMFQMWKHGTGFEVKRLGVVEERGIRTKQYYYRLRTASDGN